MSSLTDRLQNGGPDPNAEDQFADVRNRVHQVVIESLGAAMLSGVQPSARCTMRIGRGELNR